MNKKSKVKIVLLVILMAGLSLFGIFSFLVYVFSEPQVSAEVAGSNPTTFALSGDNEARSLSIYVCCNERTPHYGDENIVWKIEYAGGGKARKADDLARITYGVIPSGYRQLYPEQGHAPAPLVPNQRYAYVVSGYFTIAAGKFEIRDGKVVESR